MFKPSVDECSLKMIETNLIDLHGDTELESKLKAHKRILSHTILDETALKILNPFTTTYSCETGFSPLAAMKSKYCLRLDLTKKLSAVIRTDTALLFIHMLNNCAAFYLTFNIMQATQDGCEQTCSHQKHGESERGRTTRPLSSVIQRPYSHQKQSESLFLKPSASVPLRLLNSVYPLSQPEEYAAVRLTHKQQMQKSITITTVLDTNCQYKYTARTASTSTQHELPVQVHGKNCQYKYSARTVSTITQHELPVQLLSTNYQYTYTVRTTSTRTRYELPVHVHGMNCQYRYSTRTASTSTQHELSVQLLSTICQYKYSARTSSTSTQYELPVHVHGTNCKYRMAEATGQNDRESAYNAATVEMLEPK
ncbi:hypothetical protein J6590_064950, partial [Homalodisca vitripennis]